VLLDSQAFGKALWSVAHQKASCVREEQRAGSFGCLWLGSWGCLANGCCSHGHCFVKRCLGSGSCLSLSLQYHSWLLWGGEDQEAVDGHEDFKKAKDSCGPKYVFTAELWDSVSGCEFPLFPKLD